jgi:integrase
LSVRTPWERGSRPPVLLDEGLLLVRQSHTEGDEVMATTKTKIRQRITLPPVLVDVLRWHIATQLWTDAMRQSELLFPAEDGRFRTRSALRKPFATVAGAIGLKKHVSPKSMRRTFQDLARAAEVKDIVTRAISGHATETMQHHYSTVAADEKKLAIAKVIDLAGVRGTLAGGASAPSGMHGGMHRPRNKKAAQP